MSAAKQAHRQSIIEAQALIEQIQARLASELANETPHWGDAGSMGNLAKLLQRCVGGED